VTEDLLNLAGTVAGQDGTLREMLDSALSSPSGRGVIADGDGALLGTVTAAEVLARIEPQQSGTTAGAGVAAAAPESDVGAGR
jgi:osmoprotectant transport system ATP-binding protein